MNKQKINYHIQGWGLFKNADFFFNSSVSKAKRHKFHHYK